MESKLVREARQAAAGAREQLTRCAPIFDAIAERLRAAPPPLVVTCARGSSDHAATYGKYVIETTVGHLVASVGPSVASMYKRAPVGLRDGLVIQRERHTLRRANGANHDRALDRLGRRRRNDRFDGRRRQRSPFQSDAGEARSLHSAADVQAALRQAIGQLPERQRAVFLMAAVEGLPHGEIAAILEITETNSRTLLLEARRQLQAALTP